MGNKPIKMRNDDTTAPATATTTATTTIDGQTMLPMPDLKQFLKAEQLSGKTEAVIKGVEVVNTQFGQRIQVKLQLNGEERYLTLNKTSYAELYSKFGSDGMNWINKEIILEPVTMIVAGQRKQVIQAMPKEV